MSTTLGQRMRERRVQLGLTLNDLADKVGVTSSFLSYVERDTVNPSLGSLARIAEELGIPLAYFFADEFVRTQVIREGERAVLRFTKAAVRYELLTRYPGCRFGCMIGYLEPGASTFDTPQNYPQEECILVLSGSLEVQIGVDIYILKQGDSVHFDGLIPHKITSFGEEEAIFLMVVSPHAV